MPSNISSCSDSFPSTEVFYAEISSDVPIIVLLALACVLTVVICALFIDEHVYLQTVHTNNPLRQRRVVTLLGLYPMISGMALLSLLVPACTQMVDLIASCYLSVCIYMFVSLMVEYFGGDEQIVEALANDKMQMNTPPCCCCCVCLPKITLTKKSLYYIQLLALQVAIVRPLLLFIAAVLWTDGKYVQGEFDPSSASLYIAIISAISTLSSMYGMLVIFRAAKRHMKAQKLGMKFFAIKLPVIILNAQTHVFGLLAKLDVLECIKSRGPKVRASNMNHCVLILEIFLLAVLARHAYRRLEPDSMEDKQYTKNSSQNNDSFQNSDENNIIPHRCTEMPYDSDQTINKKETEVDLGPDLGIIGKYTAHDNITFTKGIEVYL